MKLITLLLAITVTINISCNKDNEVSTGVNNNTSGATNSSGNTTWHYCGYPTKNGTPCQRHVSGTTGYCWQHK